KQQRHFAWLHIQILFCLSSGSHSATLLGCTFKFFSACRVEATAPLCLVAHSNSFLLVEWKPQRHFAWLHIQILFCLSSGSNSATLLGCTFKFFSACRVEATAPLCLVAHRNALVRLAWTHRRDIAW